MHCHTNIWMLCTVCIKILRAFKSLEVCFKKRSSQLKIYFSVKIVPNTTADKKRDGENCNLTLPCVKKNKRQEYCSLLHHGVQFDFFFFVFAVMQRLSLGAIMHLCFYTDRYKAVALLLFLFCVAFWFHVEFNLAPCPRFF